jgi:hypothetical protein
MRRVGRELWEIGKLWWTVVPGVALGVVAIVQAIKGAHGESVWFWGFCTVIALLLATAWRLRNAMQERDEARAELDSRRPHLDLHVGGVVFSERDHGAFLQLTVRVRNEGAPSTVYQWRLDVELAGKVCAARHVVGEAPVAGSLDVPMLDKAISNTPLATEITGLLQFSVPEISQRELESADQLVLSASDSQGGQSQTVVDLPALRAERHETRKVQKGT